MNTLMHPDKFHFFTPNVTLNRNMPEESDTEVTNQSVPLVPAKIPKNPYVRHYK